MLTNSGHFATKTQEATNVESPYEHSGLRNKSTFNPRNSSNQCLDLFKMMVEQDIEDIYIHPIRGNKQIQQGRKELEKKKDIIIRLADKGGGIVVLDNKEYKKELNRLIEDKETYNELKGNPGNKLKVMLIKIVKKAQEKGILDKKDAKYLVPEGCWFVICTVMYLL